MQAIRQIVDAEQLWSFVDMPESMRNTKVEIIVFPTETPPSKAQVDYTALDRLCGSLHEYANPDLISGEKNAWKTAVLEKAGQGKYGSQHNYS
jgi:hypothetical protein